MALHDERQKDDGIDGAVDPTHPMMTLNDPSGVTSMGGANVYAAKLATARGDHLSTLPLVKLNDDVTFS